MYELYYWPGIQGRGEFVRLALEAAGARYADVARGPGGMDAMMKLLGDQSLETPPFAPPLTSPRHCAARPFAASNWVASTARSMP